VVAFEEKLPGDVAGKRVAEAEGDEIDGVVDLPVRKTAAGKGHDDASFGDEVIVTHCACVVRGSARECGSSG
jgi:hypothetical protein